MRSYVISVAFWYIRVRPYWQSCFRCGKRWAVSVAAKEVPHFQKKKLEKKRHWAREGAKFLYDWAQRGLHIHARNMHVLDFRMSGGFLFINLVYICSTIASVFAYMIYVKLWGSKGIKMTARAHSFRCYMLGFRTVRKSVSTRMKLAIRWTKLHILCPPSHNRHVPCHKLCYT